MEFQGKVAIVTGASRGIGKFISKTLATSGVKIIAVARNMDALSDTCNAIEKSGGQATPLMGDMTNIEAIPQLIQKSISIYGKVDFLINNAGIEQYQKFHKYNQEYIEKCLSTNLHAPIHLSHSIIPHFMENNNGHIINIASLAGKKGVAFNGVYSASKSGLIMWTDAMRQEYKDSSIEFSAICPGFIRDSGMFHDSGQKPPKLLGSSLPQDVANAVLNCIKKQKAEVIVNPGPMKPLLALGQISPRLGDWVVNLFGVPKMNKKRIEKG
jgi:short-subunit dehydrogenase